MEKNCRWCHKDVAVDNFDLHEIHCSRFLCVCPDCEQNISTEQLEQHREEQHTIERCSQCRQEVERCHLEDHQESECVERVQACVFCDLELPWKDVVEHGVACGSRTERCGGCGLYVTLRDQPTHHTSCSQGPPHTNTPRLPPARTTASKKKPAKSCLICHTSFPAEDLYEHELKCYEATRDDDNDEGDEDSSRHSSSFSSMLVPQTNHEDLDQILSCPHCHLALPLLTLHWHQAKCQRYIRSFK